MLSTHTQKKIQTFVLLKIVIFIKLFCFIVLKEKKLIHLQNLWFNSDSTENRVVWHCVTGIAMNAEYKYTGKM